LRSISDGAVLHDWAPKRSFLKRPTVEEMEDETDAVDR
jgi:hypothetical protein